jgi:hypothetical protein
MAFGGVGNAPSTDVFQARLETDLAGVSDTLTLLPYKGNKILVNGESVPVPSAGMTRLVGDNLITAAGADSGAPGAASTLYYVYVSNSKSPFSPSSIRLSATAPVIVSGVKYLGNAGNALNWRFVGWVFLNATPQFESSEANALIVNYYNRLLLTIFANPKYTDDGSETTYSVAGNWAAANGGVGSQVQFIANGEDTEIIRTNALHSAGSGVTVFSGPGIDNAPPLKASRTGVLAVGGYAATADDSKILSEGFHVADLYGASDGAGAFASDMVRMGAAADPRGSMVIVSLYA